jgi:hypothetical protein
MAAISAELAGTFERQGCSAESWQNRMEEWKERVLPHSPTNEVPVSLVFLLRLWFFWDGGRVARSERHRCARRGGFCDGRLGAGDVPVIL